MHKKSSKFSVLILNQQSSPNIIGTFCFNSSRDTDKFKDFDNEVVEGILVIKDSNGYIICGYIYEGDELPLDFICPICGQSRESFEKI